MMFKQKSNQSPIMGLLVMVLFVVALYFLASAVLTILKFLTPVMVIATLVINYRVYPEYFKMVMGLLKKSPFLGVATGILSFMAFPVVAGYLLVKALLGRKLNNIKDGMRDAREKEYVDYEEVKEDDPDYVDLEPLDLEPLEKEIVIERKTSAPNNNEYDDLFKD